MKAVRLIRAARRMTAARRGTIGAACALAGLAAVSAATMTDRAERSAPLRRAATEVRKIDRLDIPALQTQSRPSAIAPAGSRNPFQFSSPASVTPAPTAAAPIQPSATFALLPPTEARTIAPMRLIGVAEKRDDTGAAMRTAVISAAGNLFLVKAGDSVGTRYRVLSVSEDAAEVRDEIDGSTMTLAFR